MARSREYVYLQFKVSIHLLEQICNQAVVQFSVHKTAQLKADKGLDTKQTFRRSIFI